MKNPLRLIDKRGLMILLGSMLLLTLVSVIVIVLVVSQRSARTARVEEERRRREQQAFTSSMTFGIEDFHLEYLDPRLGFTYPVRQPRSTWTPEEVERRWIDPSEAGLDTLSADNDAQVGRSLGVPGPGRLP